MRKRLAGWFIVAFLIVVIAFGALAPSLLDRLFAPWAFDRGGSPALTGSWVGSLTTASGRPRGVILELVLPEPRGRGGLVRDWQAEATLELTRGGDAEFRTLCARLSQRGRQPPSSGPAEG